MSASTGLPFSGALDAVQQIELAARERDQTRQTADTKLASAHEAAEKLLADARNAGQRAGQQRRDILLAEAETDVLTIRHTAATTADRIGERTGAALPVLLDRLTAVLLLDEGAMTCSSR